MSDRRPARVRVAVVDDDEISRVGMAAILDRHPAIEVAAATDHDDAFRHLSAWGPLDVVLVDAADPRRSDDHFPGVEVVHQIRRSDPEGATTVVVVTGHFFDDAVRRRMREAHADLFFHRTEVQDAGRLLEIVLDPGRWRQGVPDPVDPEHLLRLGVSSTTQVNEAVRHARDSGWGTAPPPPRSRAWVRLREEFDRVARLTPITSDGRPPDRRQDTPSLPQIERFLQWATRSDDRRPRG